MITLRPKGFEALSRFTTEPQRPDKWFEAAFEVGLGERLEIATLEMALKAFHGLPEDTYLSVNASPATILTGDLTKLFRGLPANRLMLEVTEHAVVANYEALIEALEPLRRSGIRLAIDDAGAGYSSLQHIVALAPDSIKLDMSLTRAIDTDMARRALASALVFFSKETGSTIIAEGIETTNELDTLMHLGVQYGQGYLLGRPVDLKDALILVPHLPAESVSQIGLVA